jgi:DNA adenine methylase
VSEAGPAQPFLKWAGGKRQLLPVLRGYYPADFGAYHEPFLGSGAVFFDLWSRGHLAGRRVHLSDENPDLVGCFLRISDSTEAVIAALERMAEEHAQGGATYYYEVRDGRFKQAGGTAETYPVDLAACLIYLNRTGYNGLFRMNKQGAYNVPAGRYARPRIVDAPRLRAAAAALSAPGVAVSCLPFDRAAREVRRGDFVYFDPPYAPLGPTSNFRQYTAAGFSNDDQARLRALAITLAGRGAHVLLSNSSAEAIVQLYGDSTAHSAGLRVRRVPARRAINTKPSGRGVVQELLVSNVAPAA